MEQKEKNRIILEWITKAKEIYVNTILNCGMCKSFKLAVLRDSELEKSYRIWDMSQRYLMVNYCIILNGLLYLSLNLTLSFLGGDKTTKAYMEVQNHKLTLREIYWWSKWDSEVRIKAFDNLIRIYKAKS